MLQDIKTCGRACLLQRGASLLHALSQPGRLLHGHSRTSCRLAEDTKRPLRIQSMTARVSGCSVPLGRTTPAGPRSKGSGKSRFRSAPRAFPRTPAANLVPHHAGTASTLFSKFLMGCCSGLDV